MSALRQWLTDTWLTVKLAAGRYFLLRSWSDEPRQYALVRFDYDSLPEDYFESYPFKERARYIYLGEMPNFAGHCIVMDDDGKHYVGFHTENFVELSEECDEDGESDTDRYFPITMWRQMRQRGQI